MNQISNYSFGLGDRFGLEGKAQLQAIIDAARVGIEITPVWNKSHREHTIIGTEPQAVRREADEAVKAYNFNKPYFVDADHINLKNVDLFLESSDFFTLDVADYIGREAPEKDIRAFVKKYEKYVGLLEVNGIDEGIEITTGDIRRAAGKVLFAIKEAGKIYRHIEKAKGKGNFVTEVSMDETEQPQTPVEMLFILAAIADEGIPAQTIAPKFTGRFNKGVDYVGVVDQFEKEFNEDMAVIAFAVDEFDLPRNLKLSVHSGSDKFSLYAAINRAMRRFGTGVHIKTAGTTWLEEITALAESGGDGLELAKEIYEKALEHIDELCEPYKTVIDIDRSQLPSVKTVRGYSGNELASAIRHDPNCESYNPSLRQLLHVGYKIAAKMGDTYLDALRQNEKIVAKHVTRNIYERHIRPIFID